MTPITWPCAHAGPVCLGTSMFPLQPFESATSWRLLQSSTASCSSSFLQRIQMDSWLGLHLARSVSYNSTLSPEPGLMSRQCSELRFHLLVLASIQKSDIPRYCMGHNKSSGIWSLMKKNWKLSNFELTNHELRPVPTVPHTVSTLRGSYGSCKGRCLIRVLTLVCGLLPANFRIKWLLWNF